MKILSYLSIGASAVFLFATLVVGGWSGCEQLLEPMVYKGGGLPADTILFGRAYSSDAIPLLVSLIHTYAWLPLLLLTICFFKLSLFFEKNSRNRIDSSQAEDE